MCSWLRYGAQSGDALLHFNSLESTGKHEVRAGVHLSAYLFDLLIPIPTASGFQVTYIYRAARHFKLEIGLQQYSFPPGASLSAGLKF